MKEISILVIIAFLMIGLNIAHILITSSNEIEVTVAVCDESSELNAVGRRTIPDSQEPVQEPININTASKEALCEIPYIGVSKARNIIEYREQHGGFKSVDELLNVSGIGKATFEKIKDSVTV